MTSNPLPLLAAGTAILIDANVFIYAFTGRSLQCRELLERSQNGEVAAIITIEVVNEICHRLIPLGSFGASTTAGVREPQLDPDSRLREHVYERLNAE